jgi:hypothetical protein
MPTQITELTDLTSLRLCKQVLPDILWILPDILWIADASFSFLTATAALWVWFLVIDYNLLTGTIPPQIIMLSKLEVLELGTSNE